MANKDPDKARYWTSLFEEHSRSGQTIAAFCEGQGWIVRGFSGGAAGYARTKLI